MNNRGGVCSPPATAGSPASEASDSRALTFPAVPARQPAHAQEISRLILEQAGDGIYGLDARGFVTFANHAAQEMTGWSLHEMYGHTQHSLVHHSHADGSAYPRED